MNTFELVEPRLRKIEILEHVPHLRDWFNFYHSRGTVFHEGERGVCVVKLFSRLEDFFEDYVFDPNGDFGAVAAASCETGSVLYDLYLQYVKCWGPRKIVMWDRGPKKTTVCPRMFTWNDYEKLVRRMRKYEQSVTT